MADLRITFLGTGTSQGVPMIGCDCAVCQSSDPRDQRTRSSLLVTSPEYNFVIDTGPDFRAQCLREKVRALDAVVYTHSHTDHIMGFDDLRPFCHGGRSIPIYGSRATLADLERVFDFAFNGENRFPGYVLPESQVIDGPFLLGKTELTPLPVFHGRAEVNGYLLSRKGAPLLAYLSDCNIVPEATLARIAEVNTLVIDALRRRPHPTHLSVDEALAISRTVRPDKTWFTHICHELSHAEMETDLPDGVAMAYDGLHLEV
jgi:phosphoribosyl 1,2-cyclic phosphate phosphodiesterase